MIMLEATWTAPGMGSLVADPGHKTVTFQVFMVGQAVQCSADMQDWVDGGSSYSKAHIHITSSELT